MYFGLIFASGYATYALWGTWWALAPMMIYGVLYASASDARWHEAGHGTAFKTDWINNALYEVASFMVLRESVPWRWSHTRHHSDTIIVGRDPEIAVPRPPDLVAMLLEMLQRPCLRAPGDPRRAAQRRSGDARGSLVHPALGVPEGLPAGAHLCRDLPRDAGVMRVLPHLAAAGVRARAEPLRRVADGVYGLTQHAGLAENVLDHRLNCRTITMNPIHRFLYWNMNYHLEHHMFPLVPYHQLPRLHAIVKTIALRRTGA